MSGRHAGSRAAAGVADEASQIMVAVSEVSREFGSGHTATRALREVSFTVRRGQLVTVCGRSGSGKTSLLNIIGGLDVPTSAGNVSSFARSPVAPKITSASARCAAIAHLLPSAASDRSPAECTSPASGELCVAAAGVPCPGVTSRGARLPA